MVDPLSVTGVFLQIAAVATKVCTYGQQAKNAKKEIRELLVEILALKGVLEQCETVQDASSLLSSPQGRDVLSATNGFLDTILESLEEKQGRARRTMQLLAWPQNKPAIQSHIAQLERMKSCFSLLLMNDTSTLGQEIVTAIKQIAINLDEDRRRNRKNEQDKVYREIKNWISPVNSNLIHRRALSARHPGTGIWLLKGPFQKWIDPAQDEIQVLCITGTSGCGKTTLCSAAIEEARSITADSNLHCVAYFHCSFEICSSRQLETILGSFVAQISDHVPKILEDLKRDYERPNTPTTNDLIQILTKHAKSMEKIYMFLDAVNESEHVEAVARAMRDLLKHAENIRLMITCTTRPKAFDSSTKSEWSIIKSYQIRSNTDS